MSSSDSRRLSDQSAWHVLFSESIRFVIAPLILFVSGFFTASFLLNGQYSWPRTSRVFVLTVTIAVFTYEFVYKEQLARSATQDRALRTVFYSCVIPYLIGALILVGLARLAS